MEEYTTLLFQGEVHREINEPSLLLNTQGILKVSDGKLYGTIEGKQPHIEEQQ